VGPSVGLDNLEKITSCPCWDSKLVSSSPIRILDVKNRKKVALDKDE